MTDTLLELIKKEDWEIVKKDEGHRILAYGEEFPVVHPCLIHLKKYRVETIPEIKYQHMKAAHDYMWPQDIPSWHYWTEDRFRAHCQGYNFISWAGCASSAKSYDGAKVVDLWFLSNPRHRAAMIASTTLTSMGRRVWGYVIKLLNTSAVKFPIRYMSGNSPQILNIPKEGEARDTLHGIMAAAAKQGTDETAISNFIGTHPDDAMMLVLDEATELPVSILNAIANLKSTEKPFQLIAIGNSSNTFDLHGSLSTPKNGWESVDPFRDTKWETTQRNGICQYFSAYNSPAIHEIDPVKKKLLSGFLATAHSVRNAEDEYGQDSIMFWRFTLGFWMPSSVAPTVMSEPFMKRFSNGRRAHWLGVEALQIVAGLDVGFSTGGDKCLLQLGYLGQTVNGDMVLDLRGNELLFHIKISASAGKAVELQIAEQVKALLEKYSCPLNQLAIDSTGQGRAIGGTIQLQMNEAREPIKILTTRTGGEAKDSFGVVLKTKHELWFEFRQFIETGNIVGVNKIAEAQFITRLVQQNSKTLKKELESKKEYKARMSAVMPSLAHSPDEADSCTLALQAAILTFGFHPGQTREIPRVAPGQMAEIVAWKNEVRMVQEHHMNPAPGMPVADFRSSGQKKWGSL